MDRNVIVKRHFLDPIRSKVMSYERPVICGIDSETNQGPPFSLQLYSEDQRSLTKILWVDASNATDKLLEHLTRNVRDNVPYILYGHFLPFDFVSFFWPRMEELVRRRDSVFKFTHGNWTIDGVYGTPTFARLYNGKKSIMLLDSFSWFRCSLAKAADLVCPDLPKLKRIDDLGSRVFTARDKGFVDYAMRDAEVAYHLGIAIDRMHQEYNLEQSVSVADMAARIFRAHYIADPIARTGPEITKAALLSYHGGKNNILADAAPAWHSPVTSFDISSAYPHAMTLMPTFSRENCFGSLRIFGPRSRQVPPFGVYRVSGTAAACAWPALYNHSFKPLKGKFSDIWLHGYELNEALRTGEVMPTKICGFIYDVDRDPGGETSFQKFVQHFYKLKSQAQSPTHRFLYKVILNSISGKFIQTKQVEVDRDGKVKIERHAAGLFHPFIASTITAHTRSVIHQLEHQTNALHTATDGIFAPGKANGQRFDFAPASGLGSITMEAEGELCLMRGKCYLLHTKKKVGYRSFCRDGWNVAKLAMHGFQGSPKQFEELIFSGRRKYQVEKPMRLRAAIKGGHVPNKFIRRDLVLKVPPLKRLFNYA
jgi:hypothetical protein